MRWRLAVAVCTAGIGLAGAAHAQGAPAPTAGAGTSSATVEPGTAPPPGGAPTGSQAPPAPTPPEAPDDARRAFEQGLAALNDERYADALAAFEESYRLRRVASVALNLGVTLRAMGRLVEARDLFREFEALANEATRERHGADVARFLADIERRVAHVSVRTLTPEDADVTVDDRRLRSSERAELTLDPGTHRVVIEAAGRVTLRETLRLAAGEHAEARWSLARAPSVPRAGPTPRGINVLEQWWFWAGVGALVVGGSVIAAVALNPVTDPPPPTTTNWVVSAIGR